MIIALKNNNPIEAKDSLKGQEYFCPGCKKKVILKQGRIKIHHFAHYPDEDCYEYSEPETKEHLEMKELLYDMFKFYDYDIEKERWIGDQRPDLYIPRESIAIECQCSPLTTETLLERTKKYTKKGIYVLWIFYAGLLKQRIPEYLINAYRIYFGRIYVCFLNKFEIIPLRFESTGRWKTNNDGEEYYKYYKKIKSFNFGHPINSFGILKAINNEYRIARFYDKKWW